MRSGGGRWRHLVPDALVHRCVGKPFDDLADMRAKTSVAASSLPAFTNPMLGRAEDWNEAVVELDRVTKLFTKLVQPNFGNVRPDAEDIGKVGDVNRHSYNTYAMPATKSRANTTSHWRQMSL